MANSDRCDRCDTGMDAAKPGKLADDWWCTVTKTSEQMLMELVIVYGVAGVLVFYGYPLMAVFTTVTFGQ